ncbi:hypothetical protein Fmac_023792 [Flemingia macrophylla]|uniref:Uncharacterized protein n=1 Tax=Flemingia macrophylla TaxID=520843 RepID=A0ABD1LMI1_9FABA
MIRPSLESPLPNHRAKSSSSISSSPRAIASPNLLASLPDERNEASEKNEPTAYLNHHRLHVIGASNIGLLSVIKDCPTLQYLKLYRCTDSVLRDIATFRNLQIFKLVGHVIIFFLPSLNCRNSVLNLLRGSCLLVILCDIRIPHACFFYF